MNSAAFGPPCWNFLHNLPWTFPHEVLTLEDAIVAIRFSHAIVRILPCIYCRNSGAEFEHQLELIKSLTNDYSLVTRSAWSRYWYKFHNLVNAKLDKPKFGTSWTSALKQRSDWRQSMWSFLFAVCWNYPQSDPEPAMVSKYLIFFGDLLPRVLKYTDIGKEYKACLVKHPLTRSTLQNRLLLCKWIYNMRCTCAKSCGSEPWSFHHMDILMDAFRARSQVCTRETAQLDVNKKSCQ